MKKLASLLLVVSLVGSGPMSSLAVAQTDDEAAHAHFESATRYFERGEYEAAAREFEASYELSGHVQLLYNLYLARERLGWHRQAAEALSAYLAGADALAADERARLSARLESLERRAAAQEAREAEEAQREAEAQQAPEARPVEASGGGGRVPLPALVAFGAGGAGLVVFGVAGGLTLAEDRALAGSCGADAGRTCGQADLRRLDRRALVADVGVAVAAAGAVTGLTLYFVLRDRGDEGARASLRPSLDGLSISF